MNELFIDLLVSAQLTEFYWRIRCICPLNPQIITLSGIMAGRELLLKI
jgi:hypothetical protein